VMYAKPTFKTENREPYTRRGLAPYRGMNLTVDAATP
jgi:hypothetical protein